jgi:hypothetical protein
MSAAQGISGYYGKQALGLWRVSTSFAELRDILPNKLTALRDWYQLVKKSHAYVDTPSVDDRLSKLLSPLTKEESGRMRYMRGYKVKNISWVENLGRRWGTSIDLYLSLMPRDVRVEVEAVLRQLRLIDLRSAEDLNLVLKDLSIVMKKHGTLLSEYWKWYVAWDTFGGYAPLLDIMEQVETIRFWVSGDVTHKYLGSEEDFITRIERYSEEFLQLGPNIGGANRRAKTITEWCKEPVTWARSGTSSLASEILYTVGKKNYKSRKSKWATALSLESSDVEKLVRETNKSKLIMTNVAIQKREPSKIRAIITSDIQMYLKMSYISHWLETALKGHTKTTLFFNAEQANTMWENMSRACLVEDVKVPIDQTRFDHQPNRRMDAAVLRAIRRYIANNAVEPVRSDLLSVLKTVTYALLESGRFVTVKGAQGDVLVPSTKGLESGLKWTAFWGSILNYAELMTARDLVQEVGILNPIYDVVVQGDDDKIRCKNIAAAAALVGAYKSMDLELNLKKFFVDFDRDEFLRQVAVWGDVSGYPARGILSLLWRNPVSMDPVAGKLRAREQLKGWNLMIGRGCDKKLVCREMFRDITQGNGLSADELGVLLRTPASQGGFGFWEPTLAMMDSRKGLEFQVGQVRVKARIVESTVKGLDWNIMRLAELGMKVSKSEAVAHIIPNLELLHARKEIEPGGIREVELIKPVTWRGTGARGCALTPQVSEDMPQTLAGLGLSKAKEQKDWEWIQNVYIAEVDRELSKRILKHGGRRVWLDWIDNKLAFAAPVVPGWSETAISVEFSKIVSSYWTRVVSYYRFTTTSVIRAAIACEMQVRANLSRKIVHIGG